MPNRITFTQMNNTVQENLQRNYVKLDGLQSQLSSGKRLTRPSDGPVDITNAMDLRTNIQEMNQFQRNNDDGRAYLSYIDSSLLGGVNLMQSTREKAVQASNDTYTANDRKFIQQEVRVQLDQMVALGNSSFRGKYLFAGTNNQTPPFELRKGSETIDNIDNSGTNATDTFLTAANLGVPIQIWDRTAIDSNTVNGNPKAYNVIPGSFKISGLSEGSDYKVDYLKGTITFSPPGTNALPIAAGVGGLKMDYEWVRRSELDMNGQVKRDIDSGVATQINILPDDAFGKADDPTSQVSALIVLLQGLHVNDSGKIRESLGSVDMALRRQLSSAAVNGSRVNRFEATLDRGTAKIIDSTDLQSRLEDLDFAKAISDFSLQQAVFDASLKSGARAIQHTLTDFI